MTRRPPRAGRRWQCRMCPRLNDGAQRRCGGCGVSRHPTANAYRQRARKLHVEIVRPAGTRCFSCGGLVGVQDAHLIGRGQNRSPAVQWHPDNGAPLCKGPGSKDCHTAFDEYRIDREALITRYLGPARWAALKEAATKRWDHDWLGVISRLRAALATKEAA